MPSIPAIIRRYLEMPLFLAIPSPKDFGLYSFLSPTSLVAVMGKSTENSLEDVPGLVNLAPRNISFELGLNDISHPDTTLESYLSHYEKLIDSVRLQLPNTQIYICSIFPVTDEALKENPEFSQIETYNTAFTPKWQKEKISIILIPIPF